MAFNSPSTAASSSSTPESAPEPDPEPAPESGTVPIPESISRSVSELDPEVLSEPAPEAMSEPGSEAVSKSDPQTISETVPQTIAETASETASEPVPEPAIEEPSLRSLWLAWSRSARMVVEAAPKELALISGLNLISGLGPTASLYLGKVVIDSITEQVNAGPQGDGFLAFISNPTLLWSLGLATGVNLLSEAISAIKMPINANFGDRVHNAVRTQVLQKISTFNDIALFENPELLNLVELSDRGIWRIQQSVSIIERTLLALLRLVPAIVLAATIAWWVPLLLLVAMIPSTRAEMKHTRRSWGAEESTVSKSRQMHLYDRLLTSESYAKEIRLLSLQSVLLQRWTTLQKEVFETMQRVRIQGNLIMNFWSFVTSLAAGIPYLYTIIGVLEGRYTIGDIALYTGVIAQVQGCLYPLITTFNSFYETALGTGPIFKLLDLEPEIISAVPAVPLPPIGSPETIAPGLVVRDLCFSYPGSPTPILNQINFQVKPGEMVVLVGENGAGKTTLGKLLCRLYEPSQGSIEWHGQNLKDLSLEELRSRITVVLQDYARFPTSMRENVGWGSLSHLGTDEAIHQVLAEAGINQVVVGLEKGLDTPLGKHMEHGIDLSGGQWQRVAIARALLRIETAELILFDEPTAALDPKNEHEIYQIFRTIAQGRMAIVISHRLSLAKMADRIVVLEQGRVIEEGQHDQLMQLQGRYWDMFTRQASSYL